MPYWHLLLSDIQKSFHCKFLNGSSSQQLKKKTKHRAAKEPGRTGHAYYYTLQINPTVKENGEDPKEKQQEKNTIKSKYFKSGLNEDNSSINRTGMSPKDSDQVETWGTFMLENHSRRHQEKDS